MSALDPSVPTKAQIEAGARAIPVDYYDHDSFRIVRAPEWDVSEAVLKAVLPEIEAKIEALIEHYDARAAKPWSNPRTGDEHGSRATGLMDALRIVRGEM